MEVLAGVTFSGQLDTTRMEKGGGMTYGGLKVTLLMW